MVLLAVLRRSIAAGVVYNNARVALEVRARDLASLRVLGLHPRRGGRVLLGEMFVQVFLGIPPGLLLGGGSRPRRWPTPTRRCTGSPSPSPRAPTSSPSPSPSSPRASAAGWCAAGSLSARPRGRSQDPRVSRAVGCTLLRGAHGHHPALLRPSPSPHAQPLDPAARARRRGRRRGCWCVGGDASQARARGARRRGARSAARHRRRARLRARRGPLRRLRPAARRPLAHRAAPG